jgi:polysaccharide deacetylase 2 family uncharacterized protein YibQ
LEPGAAQLPCEADVAALAFMPAQRSGPPEARLALQAAIISGVQLAAIAGEHIAPLDDAATAAALVALADAADAVALVLLWLSHADDEVAQPARKVNANAAQRIRATLIGPPPKVGRSPRWRRYGWVIGLTATKIVSGTPEACHRTAKRTFILAAQAGRGPPRGGAERAPGPVRATPALTGAGRVRNVPRTPRPLMPKRKTRLPKYAPRVLGLLAAIALGAFLIGESVRAIRSDAGRLAIARTVGLGDRGDLLRIVGKQIRLGLTSVNVRRDSIVETLPERGPAPIRWRVGLRSDASLIQANYAVTRALEDHGATVLEGGERWTDDGALVLRLLVGLPRRPTHEVLLVRGPAPVGDAIEPARLALVMYGFGESAAAADSFFALRAPFAVAVLPGSKEGERTLDRARERQREIVLHLPLEPINYPRINPGPGTILVSMSPRRIADIVRRHLGKAGAVTAVANHMGSLATQDMAVMTALYRELKRRNVAFLHMTPAPGAVCKSLSADMGVNYDEPDEIVDGEARQDDAKALAKGAWRRTQEGARAAWW